MVSLVLLRLLSLGFVASAFTNGPGSRLENGGHAAGYEPIIELSESLIASDLGENSTALQPAPRTTFANEIDTSQAPAMCGINSEAGAEKCGLKLCCSYYGVSANIISQVWCAAANKFQWCGVSFSALLDNLLLTTLLNRLKQFTVLTLERPLVKKVLVVVKSFPRPNAVIVMVDLVPVSEELHIMPAGELPECDLSLKSTDHYVYQELTEPNLWQSLPGQHQYYRPYSHDLLVCVRSPDVLHREKICW